MSDSSLLPVYYLLMKYRLLDGDILDFGFGNGAVAIAAAVLDKNVSSFDINPQVYQWLLNVAAGCYEFYLYGLVQTNCSSIT